MNLFVTGYPGFIAERLVPRLLQTRPFDQVTLLVEQRFSAQAVHTAARQLPGTAVHVVVGDIGRERMGITDQAAWNRMMTEPTEWWHLAALYRLDAELELSRRINIEGSRNVLDAARRAANVHRLNYVSTAYVSGRTTGLVREDDLPEPVPGNFKNNYELTKNEAEWLVRKSMDSLPISIYRYGVVVGDSHTGEIPKFDGPYFVLKYFHRWGFVPLPFVGPMQATFNMVPVDYAVNATAAIAARSDTVGKCFQIVDPRPMKTADIFRTAAAAMGRCRPRGRLSPGMIELLLRFRLTRKLFGFPRQAVEYMNHPADYDCSNTTAALEGTGITCPRPEDCLPAMVAFYKANRHRKELHIKV
jgi:nucleoside-diphosphate-sugar epimerase